MEVLPTELKVIVASYIEDHTTLINFALSNRTHYEIVKQDEAKLSRNLCYQKFGQDLPLALAVLESRKLLKPRAHYGQPQPLSDATVEDIIKFVDDHLTNQSFAANTQFGLSTCVKLSSFDSMVDTYSTTIARLALENTPGDSESSMSITSTEAARFRKSLYLAELLGNLFSRDHISQSTAAAPREAAYRPAWQHLLTRFAPWELQQVRCAKDLLARHVEDGKFHSFILTYPSPQ